nr:specific ribonuclease PARN [Fagopyrum tataricum]
MKKVGGGLSMAVSRALTSRILRFSTTAAAFPLKNVTRSKFDLILPELTRQIRAADFVAIDLEMTGVTSAPWRESFEFDRYDIRYLKVKDSAEKFAVVQFGVCPFRLDAIKQSFVAHPHNFYIFPRQELSTSAPTYEFLCQTTSIDFLARYQFDFNACIHEGVSYLSRGQEEQALSSLNKSLYEGLDEACNNVKEPQDISLVRFADILFTERMRILFKEWRDRLLQNQKEEFQLGSLYSKQQLQVTFFKLRPALRLSGFTSHQLKLIRMVTRNHFKDLIFVRAYNDDSSLERLVVYTDSESDKHKLLAEVKDGQQKEAEKKIKGAVGFRQVIDLLSTENKLIVGHNCFLDVAHIYNKFFGPLPKTAEEFVSCVHKHFPQIIDTKILLNTSDKLQQLMKKSSTSLSSAFNVLCPEIVSGKSIALGPQQCVKVEIQVDDQRSTSWNSGIKHEAGYDAFMTGCVFAQCCSQLGIDFHSNNDKQSVAESEKLVKYKNLLYLSWNSGDLINLSTGEVESAGLSTSRRRFSSILYSNVVVIWGFPSKLKVSQIRECLCKVFGMDSVASIYHLDETAVFVQFTREDLVSHFLELKENLEERNDPISVLHPLSKLLEGGKMHATAYETYKEMCSSPISKGLFADQAEAVGVKLMTKTADSKTQVATQEDEEFEETVHKRLSLS